MKIPITSYRIEDAEKIAQTLANETGESMIVFQFLTDTQTNLGFGVSYMLPVYGEEIRRIYPNV